MEKKYKNIVISGDVGTGKSTLTLNLARKLGWEIIFAGDFFRQYATDHGINLWEKLKIPADFEHEVDDKLLNLAQEKENIVIEGHYQAWRTRNLDHSFRVKVFCDPDIALHRSVKRKDHTHLETDDDIRNRLRELRAAFRKLYGVDDYLDDKWFHFTVDTTENPPEVVTKKVLEAFENANR